MTAELQYIDCRAERRAQLQYADGVFGLDFIERCYATICQEDSTRLRLYILGQIPPLTEQHLRLRRVGHKRPLALKILQRPPAGGILSYFEIEVLEPVSPHCEYELSLDLPTDFRPVLDPYFHTLRFFFARLQSASIDCLDVPESPAPDWPPPDINYLAKDYATFRQLVLDRLAVTLPEWQERCPADLGVMLVEILAYAGDHLSYYQDAVATEAYLGTCRHRASLRRHARLVDYRIHEGCNARAWIQVEVWQPVARNSARGLFFVAMPHTSEAMTSRSFAPDDLRKLRQRGIPFQVYEPVGSEQITWWPAHNRCRLYDWQGARPCLAKGATEAFLVDVPTPVAGAPGAGAPPVGAAPRALHFQPGAFLLLEEVLSPWTGHPADAAPAHRHVVRIKTVEPVDDLLFQKHLLKITWDEQDALPFTLWIRKPPAATWQSMADTEISVARGNLLLVDHGQSKQADMNLAYAHDEPPELLRHDYPAPRIRGCLADADLAFSSDLPSADTPAAGQVWQDPRAAVPQLVLREKTRLSKLLESVSLLELRDARRLAYRLCQTLAARDAGALNVQLPRAARFAGQLELAMAWPPASPRSAYDLPWDKLRQLVAQDLARLWRPAYDLIDCGANDPRFVVEMSDDRRAHLRFGQQGFGRVPNLQADPELAEMVAHYRVGNGTVGNVAAEAICHFGVYTGNVLGVTAVRNPLPAVGGVDPESPREIRLLAPYAIRSQLARAVTAEDYERIVMRHFGRQLQRAKATVCWTGHELEVLVAVDPRGRESADRPLLKAIRRTLRRFRRIGHVVRVSGAVRVVPRLALSVCLDDHMIREHVRRKLHELFSDRVLADGTRAFFHPDRLTFGDGVFVSQIVAAAARVAGIVHTEVTELSRRDQGAATELEDGVLPLDSLEIVQFSNDPGRPDLGVLELVIQGGR